MKPPFSYYGGKQRMARLIANMLPSHDVYLEPFAGSLAVLFAKTPAPIEIVNDIDSRIVTFFRVLRDQPDELQRACLLTPYARDEYRLSADPADTDLEVARRFWVAVTQSFGNKGSYEGWSITTRNRLSAQVPLNAAARFHDIANRLQHVAIENTDATRLIETRADAHTVIYADPPYLNTTRTGGRDYHHEMDGEDDHRRLAETLNATPATVLLSGYDSPLYQDLYQGWHYQKETVEVVAGNRSARRIECIWTNRPITRQLDLLETVTA